MNRETLYDLRALLALYPYYQTARLLMLKNLYLLHDPSFDEELRRAAIYITDRKIIFEMVEAAHYQIKNAPEEAESNKQQGVRGIGAENMGTVLVTSSTTSWDPFLWKKTKKRRRRNVSLHLLTRL